MILRHPPLMLPPFFAAVLALATLLTGFTALQQNATSRGINLQRLEQSSYDPEIARDLYSEHWSTGQRLWLALSDASVMSTFEGVGFITSTVFEDGEERQAFRDLTAAIADDPDGFIAQVGQQVYDDFRADVAAGDYASAVGRLSGTAIDVFLGAKGLGGTSTTIRNVSLRNVGEVVPNRVPGGGLSAHESAGGHLIDRHVGKTNQQLIDRANGVGGQRAPSGGVSSYSSVADAERHTSRVISARQADIDAYLANPGNQRTAAFDLDIGQPTGQWVPKGGTASQPVTASRVVISPDPSMPTGYRIVTGHPIPQVIN